MLDRIFGNHSDNLKRAMDRTSQRFGLLAGNLASVNVPGYKRRDVDFGITLDQAQNKLGAPAADPSQQVRTDMGEVRVDGSSVDLEQEVGQIAHTEIRFQTLTEMTNRYFSGLKNVIREGK